MRRRNALPGGRSAAAGDRREGGFTLIELVVSMLLFAVVVAIAAELLGEAQQMLVDAGREALDPAAALIAMRLRADVQGASAAVAAQNPSTGSSPATSYARCWTPAARRSARPSCCAGPRRSAAPPAPWAVPPWCSSITAIAAAGPAAAH